MQGHQTLSSGVSRICLVGGANLIGGVPTPEVAMFRKIKYVKMKDITVTLGRREV